MGQMDKNGNIKKKFEHLQFWKFLILYRKGKEKLPTQ